MKLVKSIVRPEKAIVLKDELQKLGYHGITTNEIHGYGESKQTLKQVYRGRVFESRSDAIRRTEVGLVVPENKIKDILDTIREICTTGDGADGRVYVSSLEESIHIDTGTKHVGTSNEEGAIDI